jgi:hypothetical protein
VNQLWNVGNLRDYWGRWTPAAIQNLGWLNAVDCFRPKFFVAPRESLMNIASSGYLIETFALVPGSWIVAVSGANADLLDFQITDLARNYKFFSAPLAALMMSPNGGFTPPFWLPEPYMIAGPALLRVEVWNNTTTATVNSQIVIHAMEPREV